MPDARENPEQALRGRELYGGYSVLPAEGPAALRQVLRVYEYQECSGEETAQLLGDQPDGGEDTFLPRPDGAAEAFRAAPFASAAIGRLAGARARRGYRRSTARRAGELRAGPLTVRVRISVLDAGAGSCASGGSTAAQNRGSRRGLSPPIAPGGVRSSGGPGLTLL